jgi:hypothetical protein
VPGDIATPTPTREILQIGEMVCDVVIVLLVLFFSSLCREGSQGQWE